MRVYTRKVNRGYQLTLPQTFRESYSISVGDYVRMHEEDGKLIIEPVEIVSKDPVEALKTLFDSVSDSFNDLPEDQIMKLVREEIKKNRLKPKGKNKTVGK